MTDFLIFVSIIGFSTALMMSLGQISISYKSQKNYLLAAFLGIISFNIFYGFMLATDLICRYPHLVHAELPFLFCIGPLIFLISSSLLDEVSEFRKIYLLFFIPSIVAFCTMIPFYVESSAFKLKELADFRDFNNFS